jgi:hypothetical protein
MFYKIRNMNSNITGDFSNLDGSFTKITEDFIVLKQFWQLTFQGFILRLLNLKFIKKLQNL